MSRKGVPQTKEHKKNIGKARKGQNLNSSGGVLIFKNGKKLCSACQEWKLLSEYHKRPERPLGVKPKCKKCTKLYRKANPEMVKFAQYKSGAKRRGIEFDLSKEDFLELWQEPCHYCADDIHTIGIDRINSDMGYSKDNIVPCCAICNIMKLALPRDIFIEHCYKVVRNQPD